MAKLSKAEQYFKDNYSYLKKLHKDFKKSKKIKNKTLGNLKKYIYKRTGLMPSFLMVASLGSKDTYAKYKKARF